MLEIDLFLIRTNIWLLATTPKTYKEVFIDVILYRSLHGRLR